MERAFKENQAKLEQQVNHGFEPKNSLQQQAAEQRSANEQKINESAGEINKNRSTVQTSSDILKGEADNVKSQFNEGRKVAELKQTAIPLMHGSEIDEHKKRLEELRNKVR